MATYFDPTTQWPNASPDVPGFNASLQDIPRPWDDPNLVESPAWWLLRLLKAMAARDNRMKVYDAYYSGVHRLAFATDRYRERFGRLFSAFSDNWCAIVPDAVVERLIPQGFRVPTDPNDIQPGDDLGVVGDAAAWDIWQRNEMDAQSQLAHTEALINGIAYAMVWPDEDDEPLITIEHPRQMITEADPANPRKVRAALKKWLDDSGVVFATLYLPGGVFKFQSDRKARQQQGEPTLATAARWQPREVSDETWPLENPLGEVPVRALPNDPRLLTPAVSEIDAVIPIQDAINKLFADMIIASEFQSFRQRFITGIEIPEDPDTGEKIMPLKQMLERVWLLEPNAEGVVPQVGELGQVDLGQYVKAIELAVQHLASRTRTPPHYFYQSQFPSGESLKSAETGLVAKCRRKMLPFGEGWEGVLRLAFKIKRDPRADIIDTETIWANPESRNMVVVADAAVKWQQVGIAPEIIWEELGLSPQQIVRNKALRKAASEGAPVSVPTVIDPVTGEEVPIKDPNLRKEASPGETTQTPSPVGAQPGPSALAMAASK